MEKLNMMLDFSLVPRAHERENLGRFWARGTILAEQCGRRPQQNKTGALIGTAFTARDVVSVAEALGEDGLVRFWGFSYGTTLGATLVAMFPDKVDRVILDGVQNPHEYYHAYAYVAWDGTLSECGPDWGLDFAYTELRDIEEWSDSDEEFSHIFQHCVANPARCALARDGVSAAALERSAWQLLERLKYHPVVVADYIIDRRVVSFLIVTSLYKYVSWPNLTKALDILIRDDYHHHQDDVDFLIRIFNLESEVPGKDLDAGIAAQLALVGIHCGDRAARAGSLEALMPTLRRLARVSRVLDGIPGGINIPCAQWKFEPKERYGGDFQVAPRRPVLIVGNTWDGLTPLRSAHNVSSGFKGSVVLEVNGYGVSDHGAGGSVLMGRRFCLLRSSLANSACFCTHSTHRSGFPLRVIFAMCARTGKTAPCRSLLPSARSMRRRFQTLRGRTSCATWTRMERPRQTMAGTWSFDGGRRRSLSIRRWKSSLKLGR